MSHESQDTELELAAFDKLSYELASNAECSHGPAAVHTTCSAAHGAAHTTNPRIDQPDRQDP